MKKFLIILISKLFLFSNYALSNEILLECIWEEQNDTFFDSPIKAEDSDEIDFTYYSLSPDLKIMQVKGTRTKAKGECLIGNCDIIEKFNERPPLKLSSESSTHLFYKREWFEKRDLYENRTINKNNLKLIVTDNMTMIEANVMGNSKDEIVFSQSISQCKKIKKLPF